MKRIVFKGYLADLYPDGIYIEGDSAAECLTGLSAYPGFGGKEGVKHTVALPHFQSRDALYEKTLHEEIYVVPVVAGAGGKGGNFLLIAVGIFLIATGWGAAAGATVLGGTMLASTAVSIGVMLVLNGVVGLLSPQPEVRSGGAGEEQSNYLAANRNTTKVGTRIPLLFGRRRVWGHFLSFNVSAGNKPAAVPPDRANVPEETLTFVSDSNYQSTSDGP